MELLLLVGPSLMGFATGGLTRRGVRWSNTLRKPRLNPPNWLFPVMWTLLYALMGVASWRVYTSTSKDEEVRQSALVWYAVQLALNSAWSPLYFTLHRIDLALLDGAALTAAIAYTTLRFYQVDAIAAALLLPYLAWSAFALWLTAQILALNGRTGAQAQTKAYSTPH